MMIKIINKLFVTSVLGFGLCSCSDHNHEEAVKWHELRELDELSEFGEAYYEKKDMESLKELAPKLVNACDELLQSSVPTNAKNKAVIKELLKDVQGLRDLLTMSTSMTDAQLSSAIEGFHPLVMKLMGKAGLPHIHAHSDEHDEQDEHSEHGHEEDHK